MGIVLGPNRYGKAESHLVRIYRDTPRHEIRDLLVSTALSGEFDEAHIVGDQAAVLPTDTQKNTVFAFAKEMGVGEIEDFAVSLGRHFVATVPSVLSARIEVDGGVTPETAPLVAAAGANVLVAGSAVFKGGTRDSYAANISAIRKAADAARKAAA